MNTDISVVYKHRHLVCLNICHFEYNDISRHFMCYFMSWHLMMTPASNYIDTWCLPMWTNLCCEMIVGCQVFSYLLLGRWVASCFWWQSAYDIWWKTRDRPCLMPFFIFLYVMWLAFEGCSWTLLALIIVSIQAILRAMSSHHIERRTGS